MNPRIGKLILYGVLYGCLDPLLTVAATVSAKSPFVSSFEDRDASDAAKLMFLEGDSDLMATLNAYEGWKSLATPPSSSLANFPNTREGQTGAPERYERYERSGSHQQEAHHGSRQQQEDFCLQHHL